MKAGNQFRRVNGHLHLRALRIALEQHVATTDVGPANYVHAIYAS